MVIISLLPTTGMTIDLNNKIYVPGDGNSSNFLKTPNLNWEKIAEHYTPAKDIVDWEKRVKKGHWKQGKSAYETAASWYNANPDLPQEIKALFGDSAELLIATPEHVTPLPGRGDGSRSDVLAFVRTNGKICAVTVEGKVGERFGDTVGAWLKEASSENSLANRMERLKGIYAELGFAQPPTNNIRYQLLHRTAAAILEAKRFKTSCAAMVVHSFSPEQKSFEDFAAFLALFDIYSVKPGRLYTTDKPGIPLHFGWAVSPKQPIVAADATAVAKTTTPPKPATSVVKLTDTPSAVTQSSKTQSIMIIIGLVAVLVLAGFGVVFVRRASRTKSKIVQNNNIEPTENVDADEEKSDDEQGKLFESYVENLLANRENVKLLKPSGKYDYPDFEMEILNENQRIFLECKWRKAFFQGRYDVIKNGNQLRKYKKYQKAHGHPFFIVLGVGGTEEKPDYLYTIPLEKLPETKLNYEQLLGYMQKATGYCHYNSATNTLTIR